MKKVFEKLHKGLVRRQLKVILIGGHALQGYGIVRQTIDIDWLIKENDIPEIKEMMRENGYRLIAETENFLRFHHGEEDILDIDMLVVNDDTFASIHDEGHSIKIADETWPIPSPAHLIALKIHAMKNNPKRQNRDIPDIVEIIRKTGDQVSDEELRRLCQKYGAEDIYQKIKGFLK